MPTRKLTIATLIIFGTMICLIALHSHGIAQLELPYIVRSALVVMNGATTGLAATFLWMHWIRVAD